uniref:Uncharacterized protein n=1 Tax=Setaria viridis TaxID=4556 RepID=A0A4U6TA28_SETVI|nr:hypothetical protein SEVIR_8G000850v2 [Setaria viridis]
MLLPPPPEKPPPPVLAAAAAVLRGPTVAGRAPAPAPPTEDWDWEEERAMEAALGGSGSVGLQCPQVWRLDTATVPQLKRHQTGIGPTGPVSQNITNRFLLSVS